MVLLMTATIASGQRGVPSEVTFLVRDDGEHAVSNASVDGCFTDVSQSGGRDRFNGKTGESGSFVAKGEALVGVYARFTRVGYYQTVVERNVGVKRPWEKGWNHDRWHAELPVLLRRIRNPIPMFMRRVENRYLDPFESVGRYCLSRTSSYDLVQGDFLPPHGRGQFPDLVFTWSMAIYSTNGTGRALDHDTLWLVTTPNVVDGICKGTPFGDPGNHFEGSSFLSDYSAPTNGYAQTVSAYSKVRYSGPRTGSKDTNDDKHFLYYFRIRTKTNLEGIVTNALYGKVYGQFNGNFTYYLNPTPNDRNVEEDPKRNLFDSPSEAPDRYHKMPTMGW